MKWPDQNAVTDLKHFLLGQYFYDGLKITLGVVLPSVIMYQYGLLEPGITLSLGALYVSITDNPGPVLHKRNAMLLACGFIFITALVTGFTNQYTVLLFIVLAVGCFFFSMLTVYGARASSIGTAALLTLIIGIDQHLDTRGVLQHAFYLLGGGVWYMCFSLMLNRMRPYRPAEQTLGECMLRVADYIRAKASFYTPGNSIEEVQEEIIQKQLLVYQQMENVREILFKTRSLLKDSSAQGNRLLITFIDLVDLYEQSTEVHDDYARIRQEFKDTAVPDLYQRVILNMAQELEDAALAVHNHEEPKTSLHTQALLNQVRKQLEILEMNGRPVLALKKIFVNLNHVSKRIAQIHTYHKTNSKIEIGENRFEKFVTHHQYDVQRFFQNLGFRSAVFRHSVRVTLVCLGAFAFARYYYTGHYSYWILLTIIVILKPGFSQTRQRNIERVIGTITGGLLGLLILYAFKDEAVRFWLLLLFMLLTYTFVRIRYVVGVFFMTPFILIMFSFIGHGNSTMIIQERIIDTFIGAGIAGLASYFILPSWEAAQIKNMMAENVLRNIHYLSAAVALHDPMAVQPYKLARKELYMSSSNLASALQRMLNEPKRKRQHVNETNKFILLNNLYASYTAALAQKVREGMSWNEQDLKELHKALNISGEVYTDLSGKKAQVNEPHVIVEPSKVEQPDELLVRLVQVSSDLKKVAARVGL